MRFRTPMLFAAAVALFAIAISGCGSKTTNSSTPAAAPAVSTDSVTGSTGGSTGAATSPTAASDSATVTTGNASANLTTAYNHCLTGAAKIPNSSQRAAVTQQCKTAYAAAKQALASGGKAMKDARAACEASAKQIPNGTQRQQAEAGCAKIPQ